MKSSTLRSCYKKWQKTASAEDIAKVDAIYAECEENYGAGGDVIVETCEPEDLLGKDDWFFSVEMWVEQHLNTRPGEDSDWQLEQYERFKKWRDSREMSCPCCGMC